MPKFSVIVPIYNVENFLNQCIESVLKQTFTDFELILVDDGSPDTSPKICDEYAKKDSRIKVIHKNNSGLVSARIAGADIATGDYIACVDGDDWIEENYLELFFNNIQKYNPDILSCGDIISDGTNKVFEDTTFPEDFYDKERIKKELFPILIENSRGRYFSPPVSGKVFKKEIYIHNQKSVPTDINIGEDAACTKFCLYEAESYCQIGSCCYYYRINTSSMTKSKKMFNLEEPKKLGQYFMNHKRFDIFDYSEQVSRMVVHLLFNAVMTQFYNKEGYKKAVVIIKNTLDDEYYKNAIKNCKYSPFYIKGNMARLTLKYRLYPLIWLYNKIK